MTNDEMRRRVTAARVARLGTVAPHGGPRLVPFCFAVDGDELWWAVDAKPKSTSRLRRLDDIAVQPTVSVLVDHYDDDWSRLWWVRVDGTARVVDGGDAERGRTLLMQKYEQYRRQPPGGPVVAITATRWTGWSFT